MLMTWRYSTYLEKKIRKDSYLGYNYSLRVYLDLKLNLSRDKTVTAAFHLYNREAKRELKV